MKLKKNVKRLIIILLIIILLCLALVFVPKLFSKKPTIKEAKILKTIDDYGYVLKDNKSKEYQRLFKDLSDILTTEDIDEELYAKKLAEMFIVDFYSLSDKSSKTDVGGVDIVYPDSLSNFLENAENTFYKYVESDIYDNRTQQLPKVDTVTIESIEKKPYAYGENIDEDAYSLNVTWTYTNESFTNYQNKATLVFAHQDKKLYLVELQ